MARSDLDVERAEREAADWFTRLGSKVIPTKLVEDFYAWRRDPLNNESYLRLEEVWKKASRLQDDPDIDVAVHEALKRGAERRKAGLLAGLASKKVLGSVILALAIVAGGYLVLRPQSYSTGVGEQKIVRLADGTRVTLDTDSALKVRLTKHHRDIRMTRGQALFDVAKDSARPFVVSSDRGLVRALGTQFEVELRAADMKVTLIEGLVEVRDLQGSAGGDVWILAPGQQVAVGRAQGAMSTPAAADVAADTSWTTGRLTFRETPLAEAIEEVNRYSRDKIELGAPAFSDRPVNGAFETGDTQAFAGAVASLFDLEATRPHGGKIVLQTRESGGDR